MRNAEDEKTQSCASVTGLLHRRHLLAMPSASAGGGRTGCCPVLPLQVLELRDFFDANICAAISNIDLRNLCCRSIACCKSSYPIISSHPGAGACAVALQLQQRVQDQ